MNKVKNTINDEATLRKHLAKEWRRWRREQPRIARWAYRFMRHYVYRQ